MDDKKINELESTDKDVDGTDSKEETEEFVSEEPAVQEVVEPKVVETINQEYSVNEDKEPTKEFDIVGNKEPQQDPLKEEPKKKSKKKLILILSLVLLLVVAIVVVVVLFLNKDKKKDPEKPKEPEVVEPTISDEEYEQIMISYGDKLYEYVRDYIGVGNKVADIKIEEMTNLLETSVVICETSIIDNNGNITLENCSIDESENKYSYKKEHVATVGSKKNFAVSKNGKISFKYQITSYDRGGDDQPTKTYSFNCEENSCAIEKVYGYQAIVREESGKKYIYDFKNKKKIYTVLPGYDLTIIGTINDDYIESPSNLILLKNDKKDEALFNTKTNQFVFNYGEYTYDWSVEVGEKSYTSPCSSCLYHNCDFPEYSTYLKIHKDNYTGVVKTSNFEIFLEPTEYNDVSVAGDYIYTEKDNKTGLLFYDSKTKNIEKLSDPIYDEISIYTDYIYATKSGKIGAFDTKMKKQYLAGKFYDAVGMAKHDGKHYGLILTGNIIKLLDEDGKTLKTFKDVYIPEGAKYANTKSKFWSEKDMPGFKLTDPQYLGALASSQCELICANKYGDDSSRYLSCVDQCQRNYLKEHDKGCLEYFYDFDNEKIRKITDMCYNILGC